MKDSHIVIVEDNPPDVLVFREALRRRGMAFTLEHFVNGEDAAKAVSFRSMPPDLFVLDLNLPRIHGLELLQLIRSNPVTAGTLVAILTSSQAPGDKARAEGLAADLYLVKPDGFKEFVDRVGAAIEELLNGRTSASEAETLTAGCPALPGRPVRAVAALQAGRGRRHAGGKVRRAGFPR